MGSAVVQLSAEEARDLTDRIKFAVEGAWLLIKQAYETRAWAALGYGSWDDYCTREFGSSRLKLPKEERQEVVASLRESGLSTRAIASALGVAKGTIDNDLATGGQNWPPDAEGSKPVTGVDGKSYAASNVEASGTSVMDRLRRAAEEHPVVDPDAPFKSKANVKARVAKAKEMAAAGYTSRQIAPEIGISADNMTAFRERHGIEVPADAVVGKTMRRNSNLILDETVTMLEAAASGLALVEFDQLDQDGFEHWIPSLSDSIRFLNRFTKQLKESRNARV